MSKRGPRIGSSSGVFAKRGDPWVTQREADRDFPLNRTAFPDEEKKDFHLSILEGRLKRRNDLLRAKMGLPTGDFKKPRLQKVEIDPDLDAFTKASRAPERFEPGPDKPGELRETSKTAALRRAANINLRVTQARRVPTSSPTVHHVENPNVKSHDSTGWLYRGKNKRGR